MVEAELETNEASSRELEIDWPRVVVSLRLFGVQLNAPLNLFWNNEQLFYLDGSLFDNISLDSRLVAKLLRMLGYMPMLSIFVTERSWIWLQLIKLFNENLPIWNCLVSTNSEKCKEKLILAMLNPRGLMASMPKQKITSTFPRCGGLVVSRVGSWLWDFGFDSSYSNFFHKTLPIFKCLVLCCLRGKTFLNKHILRKTYLSHRYFTAISVLYHSQFKHWAILSAIGFFKICF